MGGSGREGATTVVGVPAPAGLICGILVGPVLIGLGVVQAVMREDFGPSREPLNALATGSPGWIQVATVVASGVLAIAASAGIGMATAPFRLPAMFVATHGIGLVVLGGLMAAVPVGPGSTAPGAVGAVHIAHFVASAVALLAVAGAFVFLAGWFAVRGYRALAVGSRVCCVGCVFLGPAVFAVAMGSVYFWMAAMSGWGWLTIVSLALYRVGHHRDRDRERPPRYIRPHR